MIINWLKNSNTKNLIFCSEIEGCVALESVNRNRVNISQVFLGYVLIVSRCGLYPMSYDILVVCTLSLKIESVKTGNTFLVE